MAVNTYDPGSVSVIWGAIPVVGFASGAMVTVEWNQPQANLHMGTKGEASRAVVRDKSGRITIRTSATSSANDLLDIQAALDELTGAGALPVAVIDASGTSLYFGDAAWLSQRPTREFGDSVAELEWVLEVAQLIGHHGSN